MAFAARSKVCAAELILVVAVLNVVAAVPIVAAATVCSVNIFIDKHFITVTVTHNGDMGG